MEEAASQDRQMKSPILLLPLILCSCSSLPTEHDVPNAAWVEPGVMRGGQPNAGGWAYLQEIGLTNIIKLNTGKADAVLEGMTVLWVPMTTVDQTIGKPRPSDLRLAVESIRPGTFIHCERGESRTGLVVGAYRVTVNHWSRDKAWEEMVQHGFNPLLRGLVWSWEEDVK